MLRDPPRTERNLTLGIMGASVLVAALFTVLVLFLEPCRLWDWLIGLVATVVAAVLAVAGGLWLNRQRVRADDASREERIRQALRSELEETIEALDPSGPGLIVQLPDRSTRTAHVTILSPIALEEAYRSGLFEPRVGFNSIRLARKIRVYNFKVSHLLTLAAGAPAANYVRALDDVEESRRAVSADCMTMFLALGGRREDLELGEGSEDSP